MRKPTSLTDVVVAVTGLHRGENPQPGGAVIASLRRRAPDMRVIGLCYDPMESGIFSQSLDRLDRSFLLPYPRTGSAALLRRLDEICAEERIDLIVPCLDSEIVNYVELAPALAERGIQLCLPTLQAFEERDKTNISELCLEAGVPTPRTFQASDPDQLAHYAQEIGFPCFVKGQLYGARKVYTKDEIYAAFNAIHSVWGGMILVQELVTGEEYNLTGLGDGEGGIAGHCTVRKLLHSHQGKGFGGVVVEDPMVVDAAERIIARLRWNGPFELEFLKSPERPHVMFEMNPRFPAWIDFPSQLGCNLPVRMVEQIFGLPLTPLEHCNAGSMFLRHCTDLITDISAIAQIGNHGDSAYRAGAAE